MPTRLFSPNPFGTFYFVFGYIFVFSIWWAYLLYDKNETAFKEKIELNEIRFKQFGNSINYKATDDYVTLHSKYVRQRFMIVTEGLVFLTLLLLGFFRVRKVFLNEMKLAGQQRNFLLSITHELKSPLSSIKLSLQTLVKRKLEAEQSEKLIGNSLSDLDRLESLVDNILFAAKIEHDQTGFSDEDLDVSVLVTQVVNRFATNKKGIIIRADIQSGVRLTIDRMAITSVVTNLVENAIKYSEKETSVLVLLRDMDDRVMLEVSDEGIGIADEEKARIFEKFYRVGNEDTRKSKGTGLGLYIVKRIIEIYKGGVEVVNSHSGRTVFRLWFPKLHSEAF